MRKPQFRRVVLAMLALTSLSTSACFGSFPLTRKLYNYNKNISDDKWMQELFFLATGVLLPVYGVAGLIDMVILNSQEFWTGKSSMASAPRTETRTLAKGNVTITQTMREDATGKTMILEETVDGKFHSRTTLRQVPGATTVESTTEFADGRTESKSLTLDEAGALIIADADGARRALSAAEVASASDRLGLTSFGALRAVAFE